MVTHQSRSLQHTKRDGLYNIYRKENKNCVVYGLFKKTVLKFLCKLKKGVFSVIAVKVICIGKLKESYLDAACKEYQKRLSRYCSFELRELNETLVSDNPSKAEIASALKKEGEQILSQIPSGAYSVALCIEGKELSSLELAKRIEDIALSGRGKICFIIGSSFGLDSAVKEKCDLKLSFSRMTFPHQLFRVLLHEQIYRAFSIINNSKYHK